MLILPFSAYGWYSIEDYNETFGQLTCKRYVFKDNHGHRFYSNGVCNLNPKPYTQIRGGWGEYSPCNLIPGGNLPKYCWLKAQRDQLLALNFNTLGGFCSFSYGSEAYFCTNPQQCTTGNGGYSERHLWTDLRLYRDVNDEGYEEYFEYPFTPIMHLIPDGLYQFEDQEMLFGDHFPDVFSQAYRDTCFLRMFLFLYDHEDSPNKPYPVSFRENIIHPVIENNTLLLPNDWQVHKTGGIRGYDQCIGIYLGNDLQWNWDFEPLKGNWFKTMWIRRLIALPASASGKAAFAQCMETIYNGNIDEWNRLYGALGDSIHGYDITSFTNLNDPTSLINLYAINFENDDQLKFYLKNPNSPGYERLDIGGHLANNAKRIFTETIANQFYSTAKEVFRCFDAHHLLFSDRIDPCSEEVMKSIANKASLYCNVIALHWYPGTPENWSEKDSGYLETFRRVYEYLQTKRPLLIDEFTSQADFEKGFDGSYHYEGPGGNNYPDPCSCPHSNPECKYNFTETGCLNDRGEDYECMAYRAFVKYADVPVPPNGEIEHHRFIIGLHWVGYYDLPFDLEDGEPTKETQNWGLVNPRYDQPALPPPLDPFPPDFHLNTAETRYDIVDKAAIANCKIQSIISGKSFYGTVCEGDIPYLDQLDDSEWEDCGTYNCEDGVWIYGADGCGQ